MKAYAFTYLGESKEKTKHVWEYKKQGEQSQLFINKSYFEQPIPQIIYLSVYDSNVNLPVQNHNNTIQGTAISFKPHTTTVQYTCKDLVKPINTIYVPRSMLNNISHNATINFVVEWDEVVPEQGLTSSVQDDSEVLISKVQYLLNEVVRKDLELIEIWPHLQDEELFEVEYNNEEGQIEERERLQFFKVLSVEVSNNSNNYFAIPVNPVY